MKVGFLGGSFNPIHNGHIDLARAAVNEYGIDRILFIPNSQNPIKENKSGTTTAQRLDMVRLAIEDFPNFELETYEVDRAGVSFTVDTFRYLSERFEDISLVCGADLIFEIEKWKDYDYLLSNMRFLIANRPPFTREELKQRVSYYKERYSADIRIIESFVMTDISSTRIREDILRKKTLNIPEKVAKYIIENNLYSGQEE